LQAWVLLTYGEHVDWLADKLGLRWCFSGRWRLRSALHDLLSREPARHYAERQKEAWELTDETADRLRGL
jgi:hypothetical protein